MKKRWMSALLALAMTLGLFAASPGQAKAAENITPAVSNNAGTEKYTYYWASTVKSYLFDDGEGFTRVEYLSSEKKVAIEQYTDDFQLKSQQFLDQELPVWGGFYAGAKYNFLIFGQRNPDESDQTEIMRVVKYSKSWQRLGQASVYGANTYIPFDAGSLRCAEGSGKLLIHTCHEMYQSSDGLHHQANMAYYIDEASMTVDFSNHKITNSSTGYVSHSFNQFILVDTQGRIITLNHGDAYPRALIFHQLSPEGNSFSNPAPVKNSVLAFPGNTGANPTGCSVGGLEETSSGYVYAYTQNKTDSTNVDSRQVYLGYLAKGFEESALAKEVRLTTTAGYYYPPQLVSTGLDGGYILWEIPVSGGFDLYYAPYKADGSVGTTQRVPGGRLSDCKPVKYADGVLWYVTENSAPTFYFLDGDGVKTFAASNLASAPSSWASDEVSAALSARLVNAALQSKPVTEDITRAEFCQLMMTLLERATGKGLDTYLVENGKATLDNPFSDTTDHVTLAAYALGIVKGTGNGTKFSPKLTITRQEAAVMLSRMAKLLKVSGGTGETFADAASIPAWAAEDVAFVSSLKDPTTSKAVMGGTGGGNFSPAVTYSREQAYLTALRLLHCAGETALPNHTHTAKTMPTLTEVTGDETDWDLDDEWDDATGNEDYTDNSGNPGSTDNTGNAGNAGGAGTSSGLSTSTDAFYNGSGRFDWATAKKNWVPRTITFNANGGTFSDGSTTKKITCDYCYFTELPSSPTLEGYIFDGWAWNYTKYSDGASWNSPVVGNPIPDGVNEIKALWRYPKTGETFYDASEIIPVEERKAAELRAFWDNFGEKIRDEYPGGYIGHEGTSELYSNEGYEKIWLEGNTLCVEFELDDSRYYKSAMLRVDGHDDMVILRGEDNKGYGELELDTDYVHTHWATTDHGGFLSIFVDLRFSYSETPTWSYQKLDSLDQWIVTLVYDENDELALWFWHYNND